ncbi:MAG TPA: FAD-binding protein [Actinomycetospora sp.]|uniref:FAD-binding oxidoreductase n=1 Tax=Actinomycetospora sp. TaxID=1872135 RepID=UPI002F4252CF
MTTSSATPTVTPQSLDDLRDAVREHTGPLLVAGAGTASDWAGTPEPGATVLSTASLTGVISHNPGDMTVAVRAGTPLVELQEILGEHGQRVAFDAARVERGATLGGLFATADSGPLALTFGSLRDLVIGATVVLADGTVAHSGGHVIKNVAGYDLTKLLHGAQGTLGVVAELILRLHPTPEATATVSLPTPLADAATHAHAVAASPVEASAVQWLQDGSGGRLLARLEGTRDGVDGRVARLRETLGAEAPLLSEADADAAWAAYGAAVDGGAQDRAVVRVGVTPSLLTGLLLELADATEVTAAPLTGVATLSVPATAAAVDDVHRRVAALGGTSLLRRRPPGRIDLAALGPAPTSAALLRAVAASLDPDQRFGRGRLAPWLPTGVTA